MQRESGRATAGAMSGRARYYPARTTLCDTRVILICARDAGVRDSSGAAPATFQARATRACATL